MAQVPPGLLGFSMGGVAGAGAGGATRTGGGAGTGAGTGAGGLARSSLENWLIHFATSVAPKL